MNEIAVHFAVPAGSIGGTSVRTAVSHVLRRERCNNARISVVFIDDSAIHELNKRYLSHDYPTDVISFPLGDENEIEGEVYISLETARRQARERKIGVTNECLRLVVHGTLHLCGYDDVTEEERIQMTKMEDFILKILQKSPVAKS